MLTTSLSKTSGCQILLGSTAALESSQVTSVELFVPLLDSAGKVLARKTFLMLSPIGLLEFCLLVFILLLDTEYACTLFQPQMLTLEHL